MLITKSNPPLTLSTATPWPHGAATACAIPVKKYNIHGTVICVLSLHQRGSGEHMQHLGCSGGRCR